MSNLSEFLKKAETENKAVTAFEMGGVTFHFNIIGHAELAECRKRAKAMVAEEEKAGMFDDVDPGEDVRKDRYNEWISVEREDEIFQVVKDKRGNEVKGADGKPEIELIKKTVHPNRDNAKDCFLDYLPGTFREQVINERIVDLYGSLVTVAQFSHEGQCLIFNQEVLDNLKDFSMAFNRYAKERQEDDRKRLENKETVNPTLGAGESSNSASTSVSVQMSALDQSNGIG